MKLKNLILSLVLLLIGPVSEAGCSKKLKLLKLTNVNVYQCDDGTISHAQPSNTNYEGLCGPTAGANAFHAFCRNLIVDPKLIASKYFWDLTPGVRPDVLESGMNRMFKNNAECMKGEWVYYYVLNRWDFLDSLYYEVRRGNGTLKRTISPNGTKAIRSPVLALTKVGGGNLHWVTVVDIIGYKPGVVNSAYEKPTCQVIYNESGSQTSESCSAFVNRSNGVDDAWYVDIIIQEYTHLVFEPTKHSGGGGGTW